MASTNQAVFVSGNPVRVKVPVPYDLAIKQGDMLAAPLASGVWGAIVIADAAGEKPVLIALEEHEAVASAAADTRPEITCSIVNSDAIYRYLVDNADYNSDISFGDRFEITEDQQLGLVTTDNLGVAMAVEDVGKVATGVVRKCNVMFMVPKQYRANT